MVAFKTGSVLASSAAVVIYSLAGLDSIAMLFVGLVFLTLSIKR